MQQISATPFGRRQVDHGLLAGQMLAEAPAPTPSIDKWQVLDALRVARRQFGIGDRDLMVLNALLSFLPQRDLSDDVPLIVFPSNATLCARAHGMAESTLRRHVARLVEAGLIARHDSPNGKRYATRAASGDLLRAFGFSLRPLLVRAPDILSRAESARIEAQHLHMMREAVVLLLRDITKLRAFAQAELDAPEDPAFDAEVDALRTALRRKPETEALIRLNTLARTLLARARTALPTDPVAATVQDASAETAKSSATDSQNERHYLTKNTDTLDSEPAAETQTPTTDSPIPFSVVLKACPEVQVYATTPIRSANDLVRTAHAIVPMLGISADVWLDCIDSMGQTQAAITVSALLQRFATIKNPGGYLRHLSSKARQGRFSAGQMVMALLMPTNRRSI